MKFTGTVILIRDLNEREANGTLYKNREVVIHTLDETSGGNIIENNVKIDFKKEELLSIVDKLNKGDEIQVLAGLYGTKLYQHGENSQTPGAWDIGQSLIGKKIEVLKKAEKQNDNASIS